MKLNPDCVRDILLVIESLPDLKHYYRFDADSIPELFPKYSYDEIMYHTRQCELNGFLLNPSHTLNYETYTVTDLTPRGHQFLADIRSDSVWNNVKEVSKKVGSNSLQAISQIATGVITEIIKSQLGLI